MRAAALAAAVVAGFLGVMYLRFSGDTVPAPPDRGASSARTGECVIAKVFPSPDPTPVDASPARDPCATVSAYDTSGSLVGFPPPPPPPPPTPVPPPTVLGGVDVIPLEVGPEIELPTDIALILPPNCGNCPGPQGGLSRVYRDATGQIRTDTLVTTESLGFPPTSGSDGSGAYITSYAADDDGSPIAVTVCKPGLCPQGPGGLTPSEAAIAIFLSFDAGMSWSEVPGPTGLAYVIAVLPDDRILVAVRGGNDAGPPIYQVLPGGESLTAPTGFYGQPASLGMGELVWPAENGRFIRGDGSQWPGSWADPRQLQLTWKFSFDATRQRTLASAALISEVSWSPGLLLVLGADGSLQNAYSTPGYGTPAAWLDESRVLVSINLPLGDRSPALPGSAEFLPAIVELDTQLIRPIRKPFTEDPFIGWHSDILAVQRGPFARVVNTDGTCLYIRVEPGTGSEALECAAEGVLLRDLGQTAEAEGVVWVRVTTPAGVEGWASGQYLER